MISPVLYLFEPVAEEKLSVTFAMFSQATSLGDVRKLITKDTVIPQISRWVDQLPPHIEIEATPHISTAASALRASREPHTAAICSPQAGAAYPDLHLLDDQLSNDPDSYTQFKLFVRPDDYWHDTGLFPTPEYPYLLNNELAAQLRAGDCLIGWRKSTKSALHLGHYSNLLTLRKLASWGNKIKIMLDGPTTDRTDSIYAALTDFFGDALAVTYERGSAVSPHAPSVDLVVAGIEHIHTLSQRPAIFIDSVPGTDGYAQMATARGNTRSWLAPTCLDELPSLFHPHFSPKRMLSAQLSA